MDLRQATEIARHLHHAADAINQASAAIAAREQRDRAALAVPLGEIVSALHFELLLAIYNRYPDLRPPSDQVPIIDSAPRWENVVLPTSEADLDQLIFSALESNWRKTARVIGNLVIRCEALAWPLDADMLAARSRKDRERGRPSCLAA